MKENTIKYRVLIPLLASMVISSVSAAGSNNQIASLDVDVPIDRGNNIAIRGSGACLTNNLQGALASGFLDWVEGVGTHAILINPAGTGGVGDPGCGGSFTNQTFDVHEVTFLVADETAFSEPGDGLGVITYEVSIHPLATAGDLASGPGTAMTTQIQTVNADGTGTYTVVTAFPATEMLTEPFFVSWKLMSFVSTNAGVVNRTSTLWDIEPRPALRQYVDNDGSGFVPQEDFFTSPDGWVDVIVTGDFNAAPEPDLALTKTNNTNGNPVAMGVDVTYTLTAENIGTGNSTNVVLTDIMPAGMGYVSASCDDGTNGVHSHPNVTFNLNDIASGDSTVCTVVLTVNDFGSFVNNATVTSDGDIDDSNDSATSTVTGPNEVDMSIVKTSDAVGQLAENATLVYTLAVTNNDSTDSGTNVVVTDVLPAEVTYVSNDCSAAVAGGTVTWNAGTVAASTTVSCNITVTVTGFGTFANTATVTADDADNNLYNNSSSVVVDGPISAAGVDLVMSKTSDAVGTLALGDTVTYTLTVNNISANDATNATVTDSLPAGLNYVSNTCGASAAGNNITWNIGNLAAGASSSCDVVTTVASNGNISNTASVTSTESDNNSTNNSSSAVISGPPAVDLAMSKTVSAPDPLAIGDTIVYTLTVNSINSGDATGVVVTDVLPAGVTYVSNTCGASVTGGTLTWNIGNMSSGASANCSVSVTIEANGNTNNTASVSANENDVANGNNSSSASVFIGTVRVIPTLSFASLLLMMLVLGFFGRKILAKD